LVAAAVWIAALTPSVRPALTVEPPQSLASLLFGVALIVGTLLGVRILWGITLFSSAIVCALVLSTAIEDPRAQTIGGLILLTVTLVCLSLPSALQYEHRRIRLVLD
jgi:accessory gene regulator protein AgrB